MSWDKQSEYEGLITGKEEVIVEINGNGYKYLGTM